MSFSIVANLTNLLPADEAAFLDSFYGGSQEDLSWLRQTQSPRPMSMTGLHAAPDFRAMSEGQSADAVSMEEGFTETFLYESHGLRVPFSARVRREMDSANPGLMAEYVSSFADSARRRLLTSAYNILNNAFSSDFLKGDGKSLCADDHPSNVGTQDNKAASALSFAELETAVIAMRQTQGHDGQRLGLRPAALIVGSALAPLAYQLTNAEFDAADDRTAVSFVGSLGLRPIVSDYLSVSNGWFLMAEQAISRGILRQNVFMGPAPRIEAVSNTVADQQIIDQIDQETGSTTWRGIFGATS